MPQPTDPVIYPNADLVVPAPEKDGKPWAYIFLVNETGEYGLKVIDEGGCATYPGCNYDDHKPFAVGVIQVFSPTHSPILYSRFEQPEYQACPSCKPVKRLVYVLHRG